MNVTPALEEYLHEMTPQKLRRTLYDSERMLAESRKHLPDLHARVRVESNERFIPVVRRIAAERGISLR